MWEFDKHSNQWFDCVWSANHIKTSHISGSDSLDEIVSQAKFSLLSPASLQCTLLTCWFLSNERKKFARMSHVNSAHESKGYSVVMATLGQIVAQRLIDQTVHMDWLSFIYSLISMKINSFLFNNSILKQCFLIRCLWGHHLSWGKYIALVVTISREFTCTGYLCVRALVISFQFQKNLLL